MRKLEGLPSVVLGSGKVLKPCYVLSCPNSLQRHCAAGTWPVPAPQVSAQLALSSQKQQKDLNSSCFQSEQPATHLRLFQTRPLHSL